MCAVMMRAVSLRSGVSVALLLLGCESQQTGAMNSGGAPPSGSAAGPASGGGPASDAGNSTGGLSASSGGPAMGGGGGAGSVTSEGGHPSPGGTDAGAGVGSALPAGPLINGVQWADDMGVPIQAHGGGVIRVGDDFFWFGENRTPDGKFNAVSVYRSRDLQRWHLENSALKASSAAELSPANVERPKVVYNESTKKYVMWMHWENGAGYGEARAAVLKMTR